MLLSHFNYMYEIHSTNHARELAYLLQGAVDEARTAYSAIAHKCDTPRALAHVKAADEYVRTLETVLRAAQDYEAARKDALRVARDKGWADIERRAQLYTEALGDAANEGTIEGRTFIECRMREHGVKSRALVKAMSEDELALMSVLLALGTCSVKTVLGME